MSNLPVIIGHRGAAAIAPENTFRSLVKAFDAGLDWVALDVRLAADDVPVVIQDPLIDRTTNGSGFVDEFTAEQLTRFDAGIWFDDTFQGEPVPKLEDILREVKYMRLSVNLELRPKKREDGRLATQVLDVVRRVFPAEPPVLISSFSIDVLAVFRNLAPKIRRGWLVDRLSPQWQHHTANVEAWSLHFNHERMEDHNLAALATSDLVLMAYTVNDPRRALALGRAGVGYILSDSPELLQKGDQRLTPKSRRPVTAPEDEEPGCGPDV